MKPREVFEAMRPFYPEWPREWAFTGELVQCICRAMAAHPERLRAWLAVKEPARPLSIAELPESRERDAWRHARPTTARELAQQARSDTSCVGAFARARPTRAKLDRNSLAAGERENED